MKAKLEFFLPDDEYFFRRAVYAAESWMLIRDLDQQLRYHLKYGCFEDGKKLETAEELLMYLREWVRKELVEMGIPLTLLE